jgi:hypothetical protein
MIIVFRVVGTAAVGGGLLWIVLFVVGLMEGVEHVHHKVVTENTKFENENAQKAWNHRFGVHGYEENGDKVFDYEVKGCLDEDITSCRSARVSLLDTKSEKAKAASIVAKKYESLIKDKCIKGKDSDTCYKLLETYANPSIDYKKARYYGDLFLKYSNDKEYKYKKYNKSLKEFEQEKSFMAYKDTSSKTKKYLKIIIDKELTKLGKSPVVIKWVTDPTKATFYKEKKVFGSFPQLANIHLNFTEVTKIYNIDIDKKNGKKLAGIKYDYGIKDETIYY